MRWESFEFWDLVRLILERFGGILHTLMTYCDYISESPHRTCYVSLCGCRSSWTWWADWWNKIYFFIFVLYNFLKRVYGNNFHFYNQNLFLKKIQSSAILSNTTQFITVLHTPLQWKWQKVNCEDFGENWPCYNGTTLYKDVISV